MSYIVIKVYSFACDGKNEDGTECVRSADMTPWPDEAASLLRTAERDLRKSEHWTVKDGKHYCPKHIAVATSED